MSKPGLQVLPQRHRHTQTYRHTHAYGHTDIQRHSETHTDTYKHRYTDTHTDTGSVAMDRALPPINVPGRESADLLC